MVKLSPTDPDQPMLKWYSIKKGNQSGGELLMSFELFLVCIYIQRQCRDGHLSVALRFSCFRVVRLVLAACAAINVTATLQ